MESIKITKLYLKKLKNYFSITTAKSKCVTQICVVDLYLSWKEQDADLTICGRGCIGCAGDGPSSGKSGAAATDIEAT